MSRRFRIPWEAEEEKSDLVTILRWEEFKKKERKALKKEEETKKMKGRWIEDAKPTSFSTSQLVIWIVAIGPVVTAIEIIGFFFLFKLIGEHVFK